MSETIQRAAEPSPITHPPKLNLRRLERIQRFLQYLTGFVLLIFIISICVSAWQLSRIRKEIRTQEQTLIDNKKLIDSQKQEIAGLTNGYITLVSGVQGLTLSGSESKPDQQKIKDAVERSLAQTVDATQLPPRIYVQIAREEQRKRAAEVAHQLQASGYIVPGIENVRGKAPNTSELRFCPKDNSVDQDLAGITKALQAISVSVTSVRLPNCGNVRPRHYEIWFSEDWAMPKEPQGQVVKKPIVEDPKAPLQKRKQ